MRIRANWMACAAVGLAMAAQAQAPSPSHDPAAAPAAASTPGQPDARALGLAEASRDYCAKADPPSLAKYQEKIKQLRQGASDDAMAKLRRSDAYRKAHDSMANFIVKVDEHNAKRFCSSPAAGRN